MSDGIFVRRREFLGSAFAGAAPQPAVGKPNILVVMADQMIPFLTGAYGHKVVQTPNLDRLAQRGVRFDAAYSPNPICAPARACLMTGRHSSRIGVHDNAAPLHSDVPCFTHYLVNAGYDTALAGKMHFVGPDQHHGFHRRLSRDIYPADFSWTKLRDIKTPGQHARNYVAEGVHVGRRDDLPSGSRNSADLHGNLALDEEAHARALNYLKWRRGRAEPFCLCVSYNYPHEPFWPSQELWDLYDGAPIDIPVFPSGWEAKLSIMDRWLNRHHGVDTAALTRPESLRRMRRAYYALVTYADRKLGELMKALDTNGFAPNTAIVFTSDHGDMLGEKGMVQKRSFYEWSARVPMIVALPDGRYAGTRVSTPVSLTDVAPTILDLAGIAASERLPMEGRSMLGALDGSLSPGRPVFSEMHSEGVYATCFMVRKERWKYVYIHGHEAQLFDLKTDPMEWTNLAGSARHAPIENELRALILPEFRPDAIERELRDSIANRELIRKAMAKMGQDWRFRPDAIG